MSWRGREVVAWLIQGEREVEWWGRYADRLTPKERRWISKSDWHRPLKRPLEPSFEIGDWLEASPNLSVRIGAVELKRGMWRCRIDRVRDHRPHRLQMRPLHEPQEPETATTLVLAYPGVDPPEPEGVPVSELDGMLAWQRHEREQAIHRAAFETLPLAERVRRLEAAGAKRIGRQLARIEQGVKAAESKLQRHGLDTSDRAA